MIIFIFEGSFVVNNIIFYPLYSPTIVWDSISIFYFLVRSGQFVFLDGSILGGLLLDTTGLRSFYA